MGGPGGHGERIAIKKERPITSICILLDCHRQLEIYPKNGPPITHALQERRWPDLRQFRILEFHIHAQTREALADKRAKPWSPEMEDLSARSRYVIDGLDWGGLALLCSVHTKFHGFPNGYMLYFFLGSSNK
jgi:hypothetical protein